MDNLGHCVPFIYQLVSAWASSSCWQSNCKLMHCIWPQLTLQVTYLLQVLLTHACSYICLVIKCACLVCVSFWDRKLLILHRAAIKGVVGIDLGSAVQMLCWCNAGAMFEGQHSFEQVSNLSSFSEVRVDTCWTSGFKEWEKVHVPTSSCAWCMNASGYMPKHF